MALRSRTADRRAALYAVLLLAGTLCASGFLVGAPVSREAVVREGICRSLLANTTAGRQALVSSAWWGPLPTLLRLPLALLIPAEAETAVASRVLSALFGALTLWLVGCAIRDWVRGPARLLLIVAVVVHPAFLAACFSGSSCMECLALSVLVTLGGAEWVRAGRLRHLVLFALSSGLLLLSSAQMAVWVAGALAALVLHQLFGRTARGRKEAVLLVGAAPSLYALCVWCLLNWLIMGDALYFLRWATQAGPGGAGLSLGLSSRTAWLHGHVLLAGIVLLVSLFRKQAAGIALGFAGVLVLGAALVLGTYGWLWSRTPLLLSALPIGTLAWGSLLGHMRSGTARVALAVLPLAVSGWAFFQHRTPDASLGSACNVPVSPDKEIVQLEEIRQHLFRRSRYPKTFVCGYGSFALVRSDHDPVFVRDLDFDLVRAEQDYPGHTLFVLVHRPAGERAVDSVHWKEPDLYRLGGDSLLIDRDWGGWRLFEVFQPPVDAE